MVAAFQSEVNMGDVPIKIKGAGREMSLDNVDIQIIDYLQIEGRASLSEIGKAVGLSHTSVRERLKKLVDSGLLKVQANLNVKALGLAVAVVLAEFEDHVKVKKACKELSRCPRVLMLGRVSGEYNVFMILLGKDLTVFTDFIENVLRRRYGVRKLNVAFGVLETPSHLPLAPFSSLTCLLEECGERCDLWSS